MKKILILFLLIPVNLLSQEIIGNWTGTLVFGIQKIELSILIEREGQALKASMDIPEQGVVKNKASAVFFETRNFEISFPQFNIVYKAELSEQLDLIGDFVQNGFSIPLILKKGVIILERPQTPKGPFNYTTEDITFKNLKTAINLAGTLTLPKDKKNFPIVIIISGSGPQNRNGDLFGHSLYYVIAHHLSQNGIGVLRYDERGVGASEGDFKTGSIDTFSDDVVAAMSYLKSRKDLSRSCLGLIGHSLGGIIAPNVASQTKEIDFLILLAAPGISGDSLMLRQKEIIERKMGLPEAQITQGQNLMRSLYDILIQHTNIGQNLEEQINQKLTQTYGVQLPEQQRLAIIKQLTSKEILSLIKANPSQNLEKLKIPMLVLNGNLDLQVNAADNLTAIKKALKNNPKAQIKSLENLNHMFQESLSGEISEYYTNTQTISPEVLEIISSWIVGLKNKR